MNSNFERLCVLAQTDELNPKEKAALEAWLNQSEKNRKEFAAFSKIAAMQRGGLKTVFKPDVHAAWNEFQKSLPAAQPTKRTRIFAILSSPANWFHLPKSRPVGIAVSFALVLLGLFLLDRETLSPGVFETGNGEIIEFILPDGSQVTLNGKSRLTYPDKFGDERNVALDGEAFFKVRKSEKPFVVEAAQAQIRVLGTQFSVLTTNDLTRVVVTEGCVRLTPKQVHTYVDIAAGQMSCVTRNSLPGSPVNVSNKEYLNWLRPKLEFTNEPLEVVIAAIEKYYGISVKYEKRLARQKLSAAYKNQSVITVLESICTALNLEYEKYGKNYYLKQKEEPND